MRTAFLPLLLLVLAVPLASEGAMTWTPCEGAGDEGLQVQDVALSPDPPVIGSPATFTVKARSGIEVPSGSVDITISFMGIQIFSKSEDLCSKTACPIKPGDLEIVLVEDLPPIAPPGEYGLLLQAKNGDDEVLCLNVDFELVSPTSQVAAGQGNRDEAAVSKWRSAVHLNNRLRGQAST